MRFVQDASWEGTIPACACVGASRAMLAILQGQAELQGDDRGKGGGGTSCPPLIPPLPTEFGSARRPLTIATNSLLVRVISLGVPCLQNQEEASYFPLLRDVYRLPAAIRILVHSRVSETC